MMYFLLNNKLNHHRTETIKTNQNYDDVISFRPHYILPDLLLIYTMIIMVEFSCVERDIKEELVIDKPD